MSTIKRSKDFSDEQLNAFVDDELAAAERDEILAAIAADADLSRRLCGLRASKDLLHHAYGRDCVPLPRRVRGRRPTQYWKGALAASVVLVTGILIGVQSQRGTHPLETVAASLEWASSFFVVQPTRILVHLDHSDPEHMEAALDLADAYLAQSPGAKVDLVANNNGIDLLRADRTPQGVRIIDLQARYKNNISFVVCERAIARFKNEGETVVLVPQAVTTHNAVAYIASHLQQGWIYVKA